jgi:hypothetical protein
VDDIEEVMQATREHGARFVWDEPVVHREGTERAQFISDNGGLGVIFQLNDRRGTPGGRQYRPEDQADIGRNTGS